MKVMVVGPSNPDLFADNVVSALSAMGHEAYAVGPSRPSVGARRLRNAVHVLSDHVPSADALQQRRLVVRAAELRPDLVITVDSRLRPEIVHKIRSHSGPVALWFPDAVSSFRTSELLVAGYDRLYFKVPPLVDQLRDIQGLPARYLPEAANPAWHRPVGDYGVDRHIVVAGNIHPARALLLQRLLRAGVPLAIYGPGMSSWLDFPEIRAIHRGRSVVRSEKAETFRRARGVLNNLHPAEFAGSNCRMFEATASGAVLLTEWRAGMEDLFERGDEVLDFSTFDELVDRCRWLLASVDHGSPIADRAAVRALRDHTYQVRLQSILDDLGSG